MWACDKYGQPYPWAGLTSYHIFDGNSITAGSGVAAREHSYPEVARRTLGLTYGQYDNLGNDSINMSQMVARASIDIDPVKAVVGKPIKLVVGEWYNQRTNTVPATVPINASRAYLAARKAADPTIKIAFWTSTDESGSNFDAGRVSYNSSFDADQTNIDGYIPVHNDPNIGVVGACPATAPWGTYFSDAVHLTGSASTPNGYHTLAGLISPVVAAM
jgi:hypothetical protein